MKNCIKCNKEFHEEEMVDLMEDIAGYLVCNWACLNCVKDDNFFDWYHDNGYGWSYDLDDLDN